MHFRWNWIPMAILLSSLMGACSGFAAADQTAKRAVADFHDH